MIFYIFLFVFVVIFILFATDSSLICRHYVIKNKYHNASKHDDVKIAVLADIHNCYYGAGSNNLIIKSLRNENPDVVLFCGDIFDRYRKPDKTYDLLKFISNDYRSYFVSGNHEKAISYFDDVVSFLNENNISILHGDVKEIVINNYKINLHGISDPHFGLFEKELSLIKEKSSSINGYNILMTHRPEKVDEYNKFCENIDLIVAGHSHGGQWNFPPFINGVYTPSEGLFPKYAGGQYKLKDATMIVSRGLAKKHVKVPRIFNRPEIVIISIFN